jgi:signal transduction histidine kinase
MKNKRLAQWLQDHTDMLGSLEREQDKMFHEALYESILDIALHGETRMVDSILESAATHAVAVGRSLTNLLGVPQQLRERIWERIAEEIDPEPAFVMLSAVDTIFIHIIRVIIDAYLEATRLAHAARAAEISRLYSESEQKVMEYAAEVARANRELAQLEQAKTDFIGIAAHELKTPLTLIQGYVNILRDLNLDKQPTSLIEGINRGAKRMGIIIEDMIDLLALDMKKLNLIFDQVNLRSIIELIIAQTDAALTERKQTIETEGLELLPMIEADVARLHQIFKQVINNAIKYTPDGQKITVAGETVKSTNNSTDQVKIIVRDTGVGVAPEEREKIFEKFYRVGDSALHSTSPVKFMGAGPGLGLAIVKGLVEAHGGRIWVESQGFDMQNLPGSAFNIVLPITASPRPGIPFEQIPRRKQPDPPLETPAETSPEP